MRSVWRPRYCDGQKPVKLGHAALALFTGVGSAHGGVIVFLDKDAWIAAVKEFTTIDFTQLPQGTFVTDQYADLGVHFTDGNDTIFVTPSFVNDGKGLAGNGDTMLAFDTPQAWIGADFPGFLRIQLFSGGELIYTSSLFGNPGVGFFGGLVSSELFDAAFLSDPADDDVFVDDIHFGVPACPADLDGDRIVAVPDLLTLLAAWGTNPGGPPDFDGDGTVAVPDLLTLLANWGPCPSPPERCVGDLDTDWNVGVADLLLLLAAWGTNPGGPVDVDGDGVVAIPDLLLLLGNWGSCP